MKRIKGREEVDEGQDSYWKTDGDWMVHLVGVGIGSIAKHAVTEHSDGTITVSPSIELTGGNASGPTRRHGHITGGVWAES